MGEVQQFANQVIDNVERVIVGKRSAIELVMVALLLLIMRPPQGVQG